MNDIEIARSNQTRNDYYLMVAKTIAFGSQCPDGKQHGAVAVKNSRIVSTGYNGPAAGFPHCGKDCPLDRLKREGKPKDFTQCPAVHAEINCIITAAMMGTAIKDSIFYQTKRPCQDCLKALRNLGLAGVVFFSDDESFHILLLGPKLEQEVLLKYPKRRKHVSRR